MSNGESTQIRLVVSLDEQGKVDVSGPVDNMVLSFGLLEAAKVVIVGHHEQLRKRQRPDIQIPDLRL